MNRSETGTKTDWVPVKTGKFTFQKQDWFDRVTVGLLGERSLRSELRVSSYDTNFYQIKNFGYIKT